jgi:hypothetical protein
MAGKKVPLHSPHGEASKPCDEVSKGMYDGAAGKFAGA